MLWLIELCDGNDAKEITVTICHLLLHTITMVSLDGVASRCIANGAPYSMFLVVSSFHLTS